MTFHIVLTDLDGTLLDQDYSYEPAIEALNLLREKRIPLIPVSSKSYYETRAWAERLGFVEVFSYEGGFGLEAEKDSSLSVLIRQEAIKGGYREVSNGDRVLLEFPREDSERMLFHLLAESGIKPRFIVDMELEEIVAITGLSRDDAVLAQRRRGPSPFIVEDREKEEIRKLAERRGLFVSQGRHFTIVAPYHKGMAARVIRKAFQTSRGNVITLGFGDSPADSFLLEQVDKAFWIKGPKDWNRIVLDFFREV